MRRNLQVTMLSVFVAILYPAVLCAGPVPDTGQTKCHNGTVEIFCPSSGQAFYGQDGNYLINPPSYTKLDSSGNDLPYTATSWMMVRDNVTGLIWEIKQASDELADYTNPNDPDNTYTWYDSNPDTNGGNAGTPGEGTDTEDFIAALNAANYGGHSDWRMPTVRELQSIVNYGRTDLSIEPTYFPNTVSSYCWSSTTYAGYMYGAWLVSFSDGSVGALYKSDSYYVRAVRSGQSGSLGDLVINGDGTATATGTGLMWEQKTDDGGMGYKDATYTWQEALSWVEALNAAGYLGYSDWRLPTVKELRSIIDPARYGPAVDPAFFQNTVSSYYWSSTAYAFYTDGAWRVNFHYGYVLVSPGSNSYYVRAVRSGQPRLWGHLVISAPMQGSRWNVGDSMPITWDTAGLGGDVSISISRDGGKTYSDIVAYTTNDGSWEWVVTGPTSVNCAIKIVPQADLSKGTIQGLFSIIAPAPGDVNNSGTVDITDAVLSLQAAAGRSTVTAIYKSANVNTDGKIGLEEAIYALRVAAGENSNPPVSDYSNSSLSGPWFLSDSGSGIDFYMDFNGTGGILSAGVFFTPAGTYQVNSSGAISIAITDGPTLTGQMSSATQATITDFGALSKIVDASACQGIWAGSLTTGDGLYTYNITAAVDSSGNLTSLTGYAPPSSGKMFANNGTVVAHFTTGESVNEPFNQINLNGSISGNTISGTFEIDNGQGTDGTFQLTRQ